MRICLVTEEAIPPIQRFSLTFKLAKVLAENKQNEVHLVAPNFDKKYNPKNFKFHSINVPKWDLFDLKQRIITNIKLTSKVSEVCRKYNLNLIYGWWPVAFFASIISKKKYIADMPEFLEVMYKTFQKPLYFIMGPILKTFQTIVTKRSEAIITESIEAKEKWVERGIAPNKIYFRPYGIEIEKFTSGNGKKIRQKYDINKDEKIIMFHGDIGKDDGIEVLLKAIAGLNIKCLIVGDGSKNYMTYLKKFENSKIIFTGWVNYNEIQDYIHACDIYVAPFLSTQYTNTTFPLKQMEAMAAGKPVICSKIKAFSKRVDDGTDIILFEPGNFKDLRRKLIKLLKNNKIREKIGKNAKKTAIKKFRWQDKIKTDIAVMQQVKYKEKNI